MSMVNIADVELTSPVAGLPVKLTVPNVLVTLFTVSVTVSVTEGAMLCIRKVTQLCCEFLPAL